MAHSSVAYLVGVLPCLWLWPGAASAAGQSAEHEGTSSPGRQPAASGPEAESGAQARVVMGGYAEAFYQWNLNEPANGITNFRGFDDRHNTFTLTNVVLDARGTAGLLSAHLALQFGLTPETYYLAEPSRLGTSAAGATGAQVWKFVQQANAGYRAPLGRGLLIEVGLFLSPVGPEGMAIKDQWNWSRSNLFFGLPFYHTGLRLSYPFSERFTLEVMPCNGWNSVVDNNPEKSFSVQAKYAISDRVTWSLLAFTGVERASGAPEGRPWRQLVDAYVGWRALPSLWLLVQGDVGLEPNAFGISSWAAGAVYLRIQARDWLYLAGRADFFYEGVAEDARGRAAAIFWPASRVTSQTLTAEVRPSANVSLRLEYRHDQAGAPMYFRGAVAVDAQGAFLPNARSQDTFTTGVVAWF